MFFSKKEKTLKEKTKDIKDVDIYRIDDAESLLFEYKFINSLPMVLVFSLLLNIVVYYCLNGLAIQCITTSFLLSGALYSLLYYSSSITNNFVLGIFSILISVFFNIIFIKYNIHILKEATYSFAIANLIFTIRAVLVGKM